jgi:hypothetical protein
VIPIIAVASGQRARRPLPRPVRYIARSDGYLGQKRAAEPLPGCRAQGQDFDSSSPPISATRPAVWRHPARRPAPHGPTVFRLPSRCLPGLCPYECPVLGSKGDCVHAIDGHWRAQPRPSPF